MTEPYATREAKIGVCVCVSMSINGDCTYKRSNVNVTILRFSFDTSENNIVTSHLLMASHFQRSHVVDEDSKLLFLIF